MEKKVILIERDVITDIIYELQALVSLKNKMNRLETIEAKTVAIIIKELEGIVKEKENETN